MKGKPTGQKDDLHRHERDSTPGRLTKQDQGNARKDIGSRGSATPQDCLSRLGHVQGLGIIPGEFERVIRLDGTTEVEAAAMIKRPAPINGLMGSYVCGELRLEVNVDLSHEVHHEDVLSRNCAIGL
jgi:hypothetical protein